MRSARRSRGALVHERAAEVIRSSVQAELSQMGPLLHPGSLNVGDPRIQHELREGYMRRTSSSRALAGIPGISDFLKIGASTAMKLSGTNSVKPFVSF